MAIDGVSRELVEQANCGIYIEPENIAAYNTTIRHYLANQNLLLEQGINGYNFAKQNFDRRVLATKYLIHLEETIKL